MEPQEIIQYQEHLKGVWSRAHAHWSTIIDPWLWGTAEIWSSGSARSQYVPSTARNIIEHASDTQLVWEPKLHRKPTTTGRSAEKDADAIESGLFAVFLDSMLREPTLAFKDAGKFMGSYGYAVIEGPLIDFEDRPDKPTKTRGMSEEDFKWKEIDYKNSVNTWNPIRIRAPHPSQILLDPNERQPKSAIKHGNRYIKDILAMVDGVRKRDRKAEFIISEADMKRLIPDGMNPFLLGYVTELWEQDEHHLVYLNQSLIVEKNRWGFVPYNHAFAGFGLRRSSDVNNDPFWLAQGLLDPVLSGLKTQAQAMSAKQNALIERSYLRMRTQGDASELSAQLAQEDAIIEGSDEIDFIRYPDLERALFQIGNEIDQDIEMGTFSRAVAGHRQQGVSTVGQQAILSTAATRRFANTNKQLNMMATVVAQNILRLVDRYGESIKVGNEVLDPKTINHDYNIVAEFQTLDPILQLQEREVGMREVQMELKSRESYRENDLRVANESLEFKRLTKEKVRATPVYIEALSREVAKEDGMLDMIEGIKGEQEPGAGGPPMPGGPPPGAPPPGMGGGPPGMGEPTPEISAQAGGGATRAMRQALTPDTANPPRTPLPPQPRP